MYLDALSPLPITLTSYPFPTRSRVQIRKNTLISEDLFRSCIKQKHKLANLFAGMTCKYVSTMTFGLTLQKKTWERRKLSISLHIKSWNLNLVYCLAKTEMKLSSTGYFWLLVLLMYTGNNCLDHGNTRMIIKNINKPLVCSFQWKDVGGKKCISTDLIHVHFASYYSISKQLEDFHYSPRELEYEKTMCMLRHIMYYLTNNFNILLEFYPFPWHQPVPWLQGSLALTKTLTLTKNCMQQPRECGEGGRGQPWVFTKSRRGNNMDGKKKESMERGKGVAACWE